MNNVYKLFHILTYKLNKTIRHTKQILNHNK